MSKPNTTAPAVDLRALCVRLLESFPSCCTDMSGGVWDEEAECIAEMLKGTDLIAERAYQEETDDYGVSFYWCEPDGRIEYPRCRDSVVMRLMGREVVKPIQCGGGRTWIVFTTSAAKVFEPYTQVQPRLPGSRQRITTNHNETRNH